MSLAPDICFGEVDVVVAGPEIVVEVAASAPPQVALTAAAVVVVVETGVQGSAGPPGKNGADGAGTTFVYAQPQPATLWPVAHGLNRYPSVTLVDTAGDTMDASVTYQDANTVLVSFTAPAAGSAYLN